MIPHSIAAGTRRRLARAATALVLALTTGACLAAAGPAAAAGTLDQQQTDWTEVWNIEGATTLAQTFTPSVTGGLDRVDLDLQQNGDNDGSPLTVEIRNVAAGAPGSDVLSTATIAASDIASYAFSPKPPYFSPAFAAATFSPAVPVTAGTRYAIVAHTANAGRYMWAAAFPAPYAGGQVFYSHTSPLDTWGTDDSDFAFKTYVEPAPAFAFTGFAGPVDSPPTVNSVKAGAGVPVRFSLGGDQGLDILAAGSPSSQPIACDTGAPTSPIEETVSAGDSALQYDPVSDLYTYVWKTDRSWAGSCRQLTVKLSDGTEHTASFQLR